MRPSRIAPALLLFGALLPAGCWLSAPIRGGGGDTDTGGETDTGTESETETASTTATDPAPDPIYLWHTFHGAAANDGKVSMAFDAAGGAIVAGSSTAPWLGPGGEEPLAPFAGDQSFFVLRIDADGGYLWHAFYGPMNVLDYDSGFSVAVDAAGNAYVTSTAGEAWDGPGGEGPIHAHAQANDIFVLALDAAGCYRWHTFVDGRCANHGPEIQIDPAGDLIVAGASWEAWSGPDGEPPLGGFDGPYAAFALKLRPDGGYLWHTFVGRPASLAPVALAVDAGGGIAMAGRSDTDWSGPAGEGPLHPYTPVGVGGTAGDLFVLRLEADGGYAWHAFFGSSTGDGALAIAAGADGALYVAGYSYAAWAGPAGESPAHAYTPEAGDAFPGDAVVLKLSAAGDYLWHAFYGSGETDIGSSVVADGGGNVFLAGVTLGAWDGPAGEGPLDPYAGDEDVFLLALGAAAGAYQWHAFYGAAASDAEPSIGATGDGALIASGRSGAGWNGPAGEPPLHAFAGLGDAFVLKLGY